MLIISTFFVLLRVLLSVTRVSNTFEVIKMRKKELEKIFKGLDDSVKTVIEPMIEDVVFLEGQLDDLRKLPFIRVNPKNPAMQKPTPAAKMYKELLQQYNNCVKILCSVLNRNDIEDDSPLRLYLKNLGKKYEDK